MSDAAGAALQPPMPWAATPGRLLPPPRRGCQCTMPMPACHSYLGIGILAALLLVVFIFGPVRICMPRINQKSADQKTSLKPSGGQLAGIGIALVIVWGLLYFFIAPIMGLSGRCSSCPECARPDKYGLITVAYIGSFIVVSRTGTCSAQTFHSRRRRAISYVAAQTGIFSFCVNYIIENDDAVTPAKAATMLAESVLCCSRLTLLRQRRYQPV